jgi:hypothetical protein
MMAKIERNPLTAKIDLLTKRKKNLHRGSQEKLRVAQRKPSQQICGICGKFKILQSPLPTK